MDEAPKLPAELGEAKRQAFNKIMVEVAKLHPPPPDNIETRTWMYHHMVIDG